MQIKNQRHREVKERAPRSHSQNIARIGQCLSGGMSSCQQGPEGGQMRLRRQEPGPSRRRRGCLGEEPHPSVFSPRGWWFVAVFLKNDSGDLQVGACSSPRGQLGGGPSLAGLLFSPLCPPSGFTHRLQLPLLRLSYAGHLRLAIVSLFAEGSSRRKLTCCSPQAGSCCTPPSPLGMPGGLAGGGGGSSETIQQAALKGVSSQAEKNASRGYIYRQS